MKVREPPAHDFGHSDIGRLATAAHYVIARTDPAQLGATKLNKILWYSDLEWYRRTGETITGSQAYVRLPHGPVPHRIEDALNLLKRESKIFERKTPVLDYERREFIWLEDVDMSGFTAEQVDILNVFIGKITPMTADRISQITHQDAMWLELADGEPMPIGPCAIISRPPTERELQWAQSIAAE